MKLKGENQRRETVMCTSVRFNSTDGSMYLGRNLDWSCGYGEAVRIMPAGFPVPYAFLPQAPAKHAAIGMCVDFNNYPLFFDCGNSAGLAVAGLNHPGCAQYADAPAEGKTNVAAYEFPVWVAANFTTVNEVEAALANTLIVGKPVSDAFPVSYLHWIIGDATRSIVVESRADGLHVMDNPVDTLANHPDFEWHLTNLRTYISAMPTSPAAATWGRAKLEPFGAGAGMRGIPGDAYSPSRFVKAAYLNAHYPAQAGEADNVSRMFHTLGGVAMVKGSAAMANGDLEYTVYTSCFSAATGAYYYNTYDNPAICRATLAQAEGAAPDKLIEAEVERI